MKTLDARFGSGRTKSGMNVFLGLVLPNSVDYIFHDVKNVILVVFRSYFVCKTQSREGDKFDFDPDEMKLLSKYLAVDFEMKNLGQLKYFLGIEIARSDRGIFLSQWKSVLVVPKISQQ